MKRSAMMSQDKAYRYLLIREWDESRPKLPVCMLNPSTADHQIDDPTILRLIKFAGRWGYGGLLVVNLFALRSSTPQKLFTHPRPVGIQNTKFLDMALTYAIKNDCDFLVAWGNNGILQNRHRFFAALAEKHGTRTVCLGLTERRRQPKHPMARGRHYVADDFKPLSWKLS